MVRDMEAIRISNDSLSTEPDDAMKAIEGELSDILAGLDALRRLSPCEPDAKAARIARAYSIIDEALAAAVRQLYENMDDSEDD